MFTLFRPAGSLRGGIACAPGITVRRVAYAAELHGTQDELTRRVSLRLGGLSALSIAIR